MPEELPPGAVRISLNYVGLRHLYASLLFLQSWYVLRIVKDNINLLLLMDAFIFIPSKTLDIL
jgi:hypothetical protein